MATRFKGERGEDRPPRSYYRNQVDARRYQRRGVAYMATIYACLAAMMLGVATIEWLAPVVIVCYLRGALLTHELMHVRGPEQVTWLLRMMMLFETPFGLGFREHQNIHLRHHQRSATKSDPEFFQIRGGSIRALAAAMLSPEIAAAKWVSERGYGASLVREASTRAIIMLSLIALAPAAFFRFWVVMRLTVGVSNFMFHHVVHHRRGEYGTYRLQWPRPFHAALHMVLGSSLAAVLCEHDAHHAWCQVKAERLRGLLASFPARASVEVSR